MFQKVKVYVDSHCYFASHKFRPVCQAGAADDLV
mgnify:CR=1 FL=1